MLYKNMDIYENPYDTADMPFLAPVDSQGSIPIYPQTNPVFRVIALIAYLFPVWLLGSLYATWFIAWIQLGHPPRPMLDDPKSIGGFVQVPYIIFGMLLMLFPLLAPLGLMSSLWIPQSENRSNSSTLKLALAFTYVVVGTLAFMMLRYDPGSVVEWWFD